MKKYLIILLAIMVFGILPQTIKAQEKKPKVALVLSGGGAKGLAHISTLQALDSLGIVPDLIIGTSMGSIVGGLYAMGYSGDSIAAIANSIKWSQVLGGKISLDDVSVEEKSEFERYLIDFNVIEGKPKMNSAILNDQELRELFSRLTYPVFNITDFDDLNIPYRAMATDIVNGKEVILSNGSLSFAMRSSMSIPGVFKPMPYEGTLLVDGGILDNFPVDIAKSMGADIIIGSDVGGGMAPKEDLNSIPALLFQASMLTSNLRNPGNQKLCDILVNHVPNITYTPGDFDKGTEIYDEGKIATNNSIAQLAVLAEKLKGFKQREHKLPVVEDLFVLDTITYSGISESNLALVKARIGIKTNTPYTTEELINGANRAMGTTLFEEISHKGDVIDDKIALKIEAYEKSQSQIKGSLHYDTYRGIGLIANYTGRNILGKSSRLIFSIDVAEQPKYKVQYQKHFGENKKWWWRSQVLQEWLKQDVFFNGELVDNMKYNYFSFDNQFNKNINSLKSYVGLGANYERNNIKPKVNPEVSDNIYSLDNYRFNNIEIYAHYVYNDLDLVFNATEGTYFKATVGRSILHNVDINYINEMSPEINSNTNGFTKLNLNFEKRIPFNEKITGIIGANANFIFEDNLKDNEVSFSDYGYGAKYFLGGILDTDRNNTYTFPGLYENELNVSQFMNLDFAFQFNPANNLFLTPHFNIASVGFDNFDDYISDAFTPKNDNWQNLTETSTLISAGATATYHSFLGPVNFDVSWVNDINKVRVFFSIGLMF